MRPIQATHSAVQPANRPVIGHTRMRRQQVVLSRILKEIAVARRSKNDTGNPRADHTSLRHLFGRRLVTSILPLASGNATTAGPRVPTAGSNPSWIHDVHKTTPNADSRIEPTDTADADHGGNR